MRYAAGRQGNKVTTIQTRYGEKQNNSRNANEIAGNKIKLPNFGRRWFGGRLFHPEEVVHLELSERTRIHIHITANWLTVENSTYMFIVL